MANKNILAVKENGATIPRRIDSEATILGNIAFVTENRAATRKPITVLKTIHLIRRRCCTSVTER